jgi:pimeloyl-ACP methyl ester carboxylesterase
MSATMAAMEQRLAFRDSEGHTISGILALPQGSTERAAVLCHGFRSNKNSITNQTLNTLLGKERIATLRFDFFGHGESQGSFDCIRLTVAVKQALAALDLVASKGYRRIALMGSSFGGLVALLAAARWRHPPMTALTCLALKSPVLDFPEMLEKELGPDGMAEWKATNTIRDSTGGHSPVKLQYAFYQDCLRHAGYKAAKSITAPTLIVQGDRDEYVPLHQSRCLLDALQAEKRLEILPGADHRFSKREDFCRMTTLLADWMTVHLSPQPRQVAASMEH